MGTPFKMKAGKEGPMKKNFGISPMKNDIVKKMYPKLPKKITDALKVNEKQGNKSKGTLKEDFSNQSVLETTRRLQKEGHFNKPKKHFFSK